MDEDISQKSDSHSVDESQEQDSSPTEPTPEAAFDVRKKKVRRKLIEDPGRGPQLVPFEVTPRRITSRPVTPPSIRTLQSDDWVIKPLDLKLFDLSALSEPRLPRLRIREDTRLNPLRVDIQQVSSPETGLPPRQLLSINKKSDFSESDSAERSAEIEDEEPVPEESPDLLQDKEPDPDTTGNHGTERLFDLDEFLFDISGGQLGLYKPLCIVASKTPEEDYEQTLQTLCREEFRQRRSGKPHAELLVDDEAQQLETEHVENRIISHDDESDDEYFDFYFEMETDEIETALQEGKINLSKLHARIDEFFTQTLGYLLLFVDDGYAGMFYEHLTSTDRIRESTQIRFLRPRPFPEDVKREIVQLAWGNVPVEIQSAKLDRLFQSAEAEFSEALRPDDHIMEITAQDVGDESVLHYWVKCLVVEYLIDRESLGPVEDRDRMELKEQIQTEIQLQGGNNPRPDVYNERSGEVFEVETLYNSHHKKITRTVDKYEGVNVKRVNIVLPNLTLLRNLSAVLGKTQEKPGEHFNNEVKFWTLDVVSRELVSLDDVIAQLVELQERGELLW